MPENFQAEQAITDLAVVQSPKSAEVLASLLVLSSSYNEQNSDQIDLTAKMSSIPASLVGSHWVIKLGTITLMSISLSRKSDKSCHFGPVPLRVSQLLKSKSFNISIYSSRTNLIPDCNVNNIEGEPLEALSISTSNNYFNLVQLHHLRYKDRRSLLIAAKAAYFRFNGFPVKVSALTVISHRILELDLDCLTEDDLSMIDWILACAAPLLEEGSERIETFSNLEVPVIEQWATMRWTVSLATVAGLLSLCRNNCELAENFFSHVTRHTERVGLAPVSALNLATGCLTHGLLLAFDGRWDQAEAVLVKGVRLLLPAVACQDVMANVWVVGDLINVARTSRMCFIALGRLGLLDTSPAPRMDEASLLVLKELKSPLHKILAAGLCPRFSEAFESALSGPLSYRDPTSVS